MARKRVVIVPSDRLEALREWVRLAGQPIGDWRGFRLGDAYIDGRMTRRDAGVDICNFVDYDDAISKKFPELCGYRYADAYEDVQQGRVVEKRPELKKEASDGKES